MCQSLRLVTSWDARPFVQTPTEAKAAAGPGQSERSPRRGALELAPPKLGYWFYEPKYHVPWLAGASACVRI